jgi:hypothetical protein
MQQRARWAKTRRTVEEILAMHVRSHRVEQGQIVLRGTATTPKPWSRYYDNDTGIYYAAINWQLLATASELDVTLRAIGRNAIGITTEYSNTGRIPDVPSTDISQGSVKPDHQVMYSYNNQARTAFIQNWSSIIGAGETKEMYWTISNDGQGRFIAAQGDDPATGYVVKRAVYYKTRGLQDTTDSGWTVPFAVLPNWTLERVIEQCREHISKTTDHGSYTFMITYAEDPEFLGLLDSYSGAVAAYSTRRLSNSYTGDLLRVRRSNDNAELDIRYNNQNLLDSTALLTFVGSNNGYVVKWYDQTGNGNVLTQTATSSQPLIVLAGSPISVNGKPAMRFDGSNDSLPAATNFNPNPNNHLTVAAVVRHDVVNVGQQYLTAWSSTPSLQIVQLATLSTGIGRAAARYDNAAIPRCDTSSSLSANTQYVVTAHFANNEAVAYFNGVEVLDGTGASINGADPNSHVNTFRLGGRSYDGALPLDGYMQEAVIWSNTSHQNEADEISVTINDFYNAY